MVFPENRLLADDSHEISYIIFFSKILKDVAKFFVCCSRELHLSVNPLTKGLHENNVIIELKYD